MCEYSKEELHSHQLLEKHTLPLVAEILSQMKIETGGGGWVG